MFASQQCGMYVRLAASMTASSLEKELSTSGRMSWAEQPVEAAPPGSVSTKPLSHTLGQAQGQEGEALLTKAVNFP